MIVLDERRFLEKMIEDQGLHIFDFFDDHQVLDMTSFLRLPLERRGDLLLVDTKTVLSHRHKWAQCQSILNTFVGVIFFDEAGDEDSHKWLNSETAFMEKIIGHYTLPLTELQANVLKNQLKFFWTTLNDQKALQKHITQFSLELDQVMQVAEIEMTKAKKIHEALIPKRSEEIKGIHFLNKYAVGEGGGGEFFDLFQSNNKVFQVLVSSQSYLISSSLMGILNHHKQKDFSPVQFLEEAKAEIQTINSSKKKKSDADVMIFEVDLSFLSLSCYGWGKAELYSQMKGKVPLDTQPIHLQKGEKIIVFSPGFLFNWKETKVKQDIQSFLKEHEQLGSSDLLMECFFQIRHGKTADFLTKDATVVMMEVNRHGIHKI